jgi:hypothetical protein
MKKLKILALALVALGVMAAAVPAANAALPEFLGTLPNTFTAASTTPEFQQLSSALSIKCKKATGTGTVTSSKAGSFKELFEGCTSLGLACTGLLTGETSGDIKVEGTFALGYELGSLVPVTALSLKEVHFECAGILVSVKGCVVGKSTPLTDALTGNLSFTQSAKGDQTLTDYEVEKGGSMVACALTSEFNGGAFESSSQVQSANLTFTKLIELMD